MKMKKYKLGDVIDVTRGTSLKGAFYATDGKYIRLTRGNFDYRNNCFKLNNSKGDLVHQTHYEVFFPTFVMALLLAVGGAEPFCRTIQLQILGNTTQ